MDANAKRRRMKQFTLFDMTEYKVCKNCGASHEHIKEHVYPGYVTVYCDVCYIAQGSYREEDYVSDKQAAQCE